jgi:hypothetical protein
VFFTIKKLFGSEQLLNGNTIALIKKFMEHHYWSHFAQRINVNASPERSYNAFATRRGMESWFLRSYEYLHEDNSLLENDEQIKTGDHYKWLWHGWPDSIAETGSFLKANNKDELQFTFGKAGTVTIKIYRAENENIVELFQENIPDDEESKFNFLYWMQYRLGVLSC